MTQPRTTLQGGYVNQMKANIAQIVAVLEEWAGTTGKPDFRKAEVNSLCEPFDKYLDTIARSRGWSAQYLTLWAEFKAAWQNGDGSWTDAKKPAKQLNERFLQVEG